LLEAQIKRAVTDCASPINFDTNPTRSQPSGKNLECDVPHAGRNAAALFRSCNLQQEAQMNTKLEDMLTEDERKMVKRWTIGVAAFYCVVLLGMMGLIAVGVTSDNTGNQAAVYSDLDGFSLNAPISPAHPDVTTGMSERTPHEERAAQAPIAAHSAVPEVDELENYGSPTGESGFASSPEPEKALQQTAHSRK
jgi:hypothetical protein